MGHRPWPNAGNTKGTVTSAVRKVSAVFTQSRNCTFYRRNWVLLTNTNPRETKVFTGVPGRHLKLSVPNTGPLVFGCFPSKHACLTCCPDSSMITRGFASHISGSSPCLMLPILHDNPCNFPDVRFCATPRQPP